MTRAFDHFLLTRFSAVLAPGAPPADEEWLWYRLRFFVDAALASVAGQRGAAPFEWLVLFDDRCKDDFRDAVEDLAAAGAFVPLWTHEHYRPALFARAVAERSDSPFLLTSRLDSDDVSGPFLTLIERRGPGLPLTVYAAAAHTRARALAPMREVAAPPTWGQVVHGGNLVNIVSGPRISPRVVNERFTLDLAYRREVATHVLLVERARHRARLLALGLRHPSEPIKYAEGRLARLRGTHERPRNDGRTLMDRVTGSFRRS